MNQEFEPMKPPEGLVDEILGDVLSAAWNICPHVVKRNLILYCGLTNCRCFPFQDGQSCPHNPRNEK